MTGADLKQQIQEDVKAAMKAQDVRRRDALRLLLAAIKQREVDERVVLDDTQLLAVIDKMIKQRQDSAQQFQSAGRMDLADQENFEISILSTYLPPALSEQEITECIQKAIQSLSATSIKDMGRVMAELKPQLQGRADIGLVSAEVKKLLG